MTGNRDDDLAETVDELEENVNSERGGDAADRHVADAGDGASDADADEGRPTVEPPD
ncbi:hypothetical protein [Williamsia sterculiae]|uniref:Uncharacterized protein n=1 Tax=Williamsia sterculiae TaxID=1344003 RepID=A0A1N7H5G4_9NOCA|nr:hypothetical protein [Williamsia sterculiae]SIS20089.1 hypothetical protein SAMN05445060_3539 [Williamsia sterculiae]